MTSTSICRMLLRLLPVIMFLVTAPGYCAFSNTIMVSITANDTNMTGVLVNTDGYIIAPSLADYSGPWVVNYEKEQYPARVIAAHPTYGVVLLKIDRQQPFPTATVSLTQITAAPHLSVVSMNDQQAAVETPVTIRRVRRKILEKGLVGSYYEFIIPGEQPRQGALLVNSDTGEVGGILIGAQGEGGERYALFGSCLYERAALSGVTLGKGNVEDNAPTFILADGQRQKATLRTLSFQAASNMKKNATLVRAITDWRKSTGFQINLLTSPIVEANKCYFASNFGMLYNIDLGTMQREWIYEEDNAILSPPVTNADYLCMTSGNLGFSSYQEEDAILTAILKTPIINTKHFMYDYGFISCIDKASGVYKWNYQTRFLSQSMIVGNRVLFSGMGTLGALNLSDGKEIWVSTAARKNLTATYYCLAGGDEEKLWTLSMPVRLNGEGTHAVPFSFSQDGKTACMECYRTDGGSKPIWSTPIATESNFPALCGKAVLAADKQNCYGCTAKSVFAVNAATGQLLWQKTIFPEQFGGNIVYDNALIFCTSTTNKLYALNAADGAVLWVFDLATAPICLPSIRDGVIYVGSLDTWMYALDERTGKLLWKLETRGKICGQPCLLGNMLYFTTDDGSLTEVQLPQ